ncbi:hypothetical protein FHG74_22725 [Vibrio diabolicus]|nr:hypothetical protein FHG74_22725 [Vibrio diabolicus]
MGCCVRSGKNATNKAFKSDSQRLAVSLRSSIAKHCSHLNAALGKPPTLADGVLIKHYSLVEMQVKD